MVTSIITGLATYSVLTGLTPLEPTRELIISLLAINLVLVLSMAAMIAWQAYVLWQARRLGIAGASLHIRIVSLFSIIAALPAIIVALFATVTLNRGLDTWFSERTRGIVDTAVSVAETYIAEHGEVIRGDVAAIASDMGRRKSEFDTDRQQFTRRLATHVAIRGLAAAYVIDSSKRRIESSVTINDQIQFQPPSDAELATASKGDLVVDGPGTSNVIRALLKLDGFENSYLYVLRLVNPKVMEHLQRTREGVIAYEAMQSQRSGVQVTFALMYIGVSFIFLLAAIWSGLWLSDRLVQPIVRLVDAARRVSLGDLNVKVPVRRAEGDLATLGRTFNRMTRQLESQRSELINANVQVDLRRRFTEAVLAGVSAGVIGLDSTGKVTLVNSSALALLHKQDADLSGTMITDLMPELDDLFQKALKKRSGSAEGHINTRVDGEERNLFVRITTERAREDEQGYVVTIDDVTELVSAQRNTAWSDIARRIAHEIKNPLTPIQLSAERLRRKYSKEIRTDPQVFEQCTETIIRQVGDIGRMIDEFSSFARMPKAELETGDLVTVVKEAMVLQRVSSGDLDINVQTPNQAIPVAFDRRLITQAVTNLVKNAREAVEARIQQDPRHKGRIEVSVESCGENVIINVADNGIGLPKDNRQRLLEPYMTTRAKGTGLGLAIVKRIMEEHAGQVSLSDASAEFDGGALVRLILPALGTPSAQAGEQTGDGPPAANKYEQTPVAPQAPTADLRASEVEAHERREGVGVVNNEIENKREP
ncbi:two-component system nitrogen regulation sensor histidine kinase NtrY [Rhodoligotrophos appendicifer]|uniref:sensor histidine kinase NtrY-like n=1 Tax=Rhodoligotrophos appendicifer TaxID=987056 RepID=UPI001478C160|nr:PAS domain-containing sensor histidine kinase [Rhodoligotrophos appendicifer]